MNKPILISLQQIKDKNPCTDGWKTLLKSKNKTKSDNELFPLSDVLESNGLEDTLWCLQCVPEYDNLWRKFAWCCAKQVLHNTNDKRVSDCLDVVWEFTEGNATIEELRSAESAARSAARLAARSAAYSAAESAAWSAAESAQKEKLKQILNSGEWIK